MRRLAFAILLLLTLVSVVDSRGRQAFSQEAPLETDQLAGTDVLLARSASGIEVWKFNGSGWQQLPSGPPWSDAGGWNAPEYYSTIQTADIDGDGRDELLARSARGIEAWEFDGSGWQQLPSGPPLSDAAGWNAPEYYSTIHTGDIDADGRHELLARGAGGIHVWEYEDGAWQQLPDGPPWSDAAGWNAPEYYSTIQTAEVHLRDWFLLMGRSASGIETWQFYEDENEWRQRIEEFTGRELSDADGWNAPEYYSTIQTANERLLARGPNNIEVWRFSGEWTPVGAGPALSDAAGWNAPEYYSTIQAGDFDGDNWAELLARSASGIHVWEFSESAWPQLPNGPALSDAAGWNAPEYYSTIQSGDIDGDGSAELLARSASAIHVWQFDGSAWQQLPDGPALSDEAGWNRPEYYSTIQTANIEGLPTTYLPIMAKP